MINRKDIVLSNKQIMEFLGLAGLKKELTGVVQFHMPLSEAAKITEKNAVVFETEVEANDFVITVENLAKLFDITEPEALAIFCKARAVLDDKTANWEDVSAAIRNGLVAG